MRVYCYCPETGLYQGEDFLDECHIDCVEGVTCVTPPAYSRGEVPVFDASRQCWKLVKLTGERVTPPMDQT